MVIHNVPPLASPSLTEYFRNCRNHPNQLLLRLPFKLTVAKLVSKLPRHLDSEPGRVHFERSTNHVTD